MNKNFKYVINYIIKKYKISSILIAISGGQDSIYLIKLIEILKNFFSFNKIEYIYIDHQWKIDSLKQIEHIINYFKFFQEKLSIYQIQRITLSENNSRIYRYHIILDHAIKNKYQAIITAHTQTDKFETFLLNLIRGTSLEGISSLTLHKKIHEQLHIIRPLIHENRNNINWYCRQFCLPIWSDISNYNYKIKRNRIRFELLPYLKKYFNLNIENNCNAFLTNCFYDNEYIKQNIIKIYNYILHTKYIAINILYINKQHLSIQTRILQLFIYHNFYISINKNMLIKLIHILNKKYSHEIIEWKYFEFKVKYIWLYIRLKI
uniref:tRNA(Ile)-lysidine synthase, chloroplastic n=1 Tax=Acrosorium ciliolatum TaxID=1550622 RepID=A0A1Z1M216_9FLOR|nr:tRNA Ile-lysidine synthetase [Acrosorium ciliolatum]ARW59942.1 tRNA Ile-lysidine synthetase [Acrosorium ciliolatum]